MSKPVRKRRALKRPYDKNQVQDLKERIGGLVMLLESAINPSSGLPLMFEAKGMNTDKSSRPLDIEEQRAALGCFC